MATPPPQIQEVVLPENALPETRDIFLTQEQMIQALQDSCPKQNEEIC
jgi:hypothetical protein